MASFVLHVTHCVHTSINLRNSSLICTLYVYIVLFIICEVLIKILKNKREEKL